MATIDLGKIAITPEGKWSAGKYYEKLSLVIYNGQSYLSLRNTTGDNPETSRGDWMQITSRGESLYQMMVREGKFVGTEEEFLQQYLDSLKACADASEEVRAALSDILNEMDRVRAEISEVMVEEDIRIKNEAKREAAEINRRNAEITRGVEERNRQEAEQRREQSMQQIQNDAEIALAMAAEAQQKAEEAILNEEERISAENQRKIDEATRIQHEEQRVNDEAMRRSREADRLESENIRQKNEGDRILAEREREEIMRNLVEELKSLAANKFKIVDVLPEVGEFAVIYLVPSTKPSDNDVYDEWAYVSEKWERIGSTRFEIDNYYTKEEIEAALATKANIQHQHTVADITDFPELYYDATAFFTSGAYPSDKYEELLEAVKAKRTVYATIDEAGYTSYIFFISSANSDGSSSRVLLTTIFADGGYLYINTFVLQQSGMTPLQESITGKADKATTLAGYGIGDAYTKSEVDTALNTKQNTLIPGNGISIEGNVIGVTAITESESQPDTSLWLNPSEDEETDVTYNRSQIDAMVGAKQDALQLTVKDNGNIVLSNIQGQSKEFMPATPSGDPMHYAYEAAGAEWNGTGADIVKTTPWADLADDDADKTVVHKAGYWYLNGLGDITNEQMRVIFIETNNFMEDISQSAQARYCSLISRTHMNPKKYHITTTRLRVEYIDFMRNSVNLESIIFPEYGLSIDYCFRPKKITTAFSYCLNLKYIYGVINLCDCIDQTNAFYQSPNIRICQLNKLRLNLNINNLDSVSSKSILYMIQNEAATSAITITLHADAYTRAMANADIIAALEAHPNVSLASA